MSLTATCGEVVTGVVTGSVVLTVMKEELRCGQKSGMGGFPGFAARRAGEVPQDRDPRKKPSPTGQQI
jgi:hypothetical protein